MMMKNLCLAKRNGKSVINEAMPVKPSERHAILDILRGLSLLGIVLANFPEFGLYTFLDAGVTEAMPTAAADRAARFLQYLFIDGKFYTLFSLLFGIGFSIIIANAATRGADGFRIFYRRMSVLLLIGFVHLMFLWSGDILMLYALLGMLLPLFRHATDRTLLAWSAVFLLLPVAVDAAVEFSGVCPSAPVVELQQYYCAKYGITDENFAYWLRDADSYGEVFEFLIQGALVRVQEFIDGNRYFRVMGLFLLGFCIGRNRLYAGLEHRRRPLERIAVYGFAFGLPLSFVYAWSCMNAHPWGLAVHSLLYTASVFPLGFAYAAGMCLLYLHHREARIFKFLAAPGRMALTNYIFQSVWGMLLFYGTGFGYGADTGLVYILLAATGVFLAEAVFSRFWLRKFRFGPLEWGWRMLTYGKYFSITNK